MTVCKSKGAALAALDTITETMKKGTPRDVLLAIKKWIEDNMTAGYITEETIAKLESVFRGSDEEIKGRAWVERERGDPAYVPGTVIKGVSYHHHKMINEPEHGAKLACFWNAYTKSWEPCEPWPITAKTGKHGQE